MKNNYPKKHKAIYYGRTINEALELADKDKHLLDNLERVVTAIVFKKQHTAGKVEWTSSPVKSYEVAFTAID